MKTRIVATGSDGHKRSTITQIGESIEVAHDRLQEESGKYSVKVEYTDIPEESDTKNKKKGWWG